MKTAVFVGGFALGCACTVIAAASYLPQDPPEGATPPSEEEMMQMFQEAVEKYGSPSEEHEMLAKRVGAWDAEISFWPVPGAPAEVHNGEAVYEMILDGRYLLGHFKSDMGGMPFEGHGVSAFDRISQKHQAVWMDSLSTTLMTSEGHRDGDTIVLRGEMPDIFTGQHVKSKTTERMVDDNTFVMEMFNPGPDGKMFKSMKITYTRRTDAAAIGH